MKAIYQLNNEKLSHNFQLLGEREFEHLQLIQQQKKKINRLQDLLSTLKSKYAKTDKAYRQKNVEYTDEYRRITEQYKYLQTKFRHFQDRDQKKYMQIWAMNASQMQGLVKRLLQVQT
jgi:dynein regulatory complex protein 1